MQSTWKAAVHGQYEKVVSAFAPSCSRQMTHIVDVDGASVRRGATGRRSSSSASTSPVKSIKSSGSTRRRHCAGGTSQRGEAPRGEAHRLAYAVSCRKSIGCGQRSRRRSIASGAGCKSTPACATQKPQSVGYTRSEPRLTASAPVRSNHSRSPASSRPHALRRCAPGQVRRKIGGCSVRCRALSS